MPVCAICEQRVGQWLAHPHIAQRSEFMKLMQAVGSDLSVYQCPACGCTDRDRHLWLYMVAAGLPAQLQGASVLHLAPERHLEPLIAACRPSRYVRGDLNPLRSDHQRLDVQALPFGDAEFDLVICNHVLEHVADPALALAEFQRCMRAGGLLIAQTPYAPVLRKTFELTTPQGPEFAKLFYGQEDHVRLFGSDITECFHAAGFVGELRTHDELLPGHDPLAYGCNASEPFFAFFKPQGAGQSQTI